MFTSKENQEMVWGLLVDQSKIPLNRQWRSFFQQTINTIERDSGRYTNVIQMNKQLLSICMSQINSFANLNTNSKNNLQQKQEELKLMREGPKKKEINFADKDETEYGNLNFLMDQASASRERELQENKKAPADG